MTRPMNWEGENDLVLRVGAPIQAYWSRRLVAACFTDRRLSTRSRETMHRRIRCCLFSLTLSFCVGMTTFAFLALPGINDLPVIAELPDPFLSHDDRRVRSQEEWLAHRAELKERFQYYEYGRMPPPSAVTVVSISPDQVIRSMKKRVVRLKTGPKGEIVFDYTMFIPSHGNRLSPVVISGDLCWGSVTSELGTSAVESLVERGYVISEFDRTNFAPDNQNRTGVYPLYPGYDWGALAVWAWSFHRVVDYLFTLDYIDSAKIIVTGFSRGGKAALLAGAFDERIALTAPNCSGFGGSGPVRFVYSDSETIDNGSTVLYPFWYNSRWQSFKGDKRDRLPVDQHCLIALLAPRAYVSTNGVQDSWANPRGTAQAHLAAKEVFATLGASEKMGLFFANTGHDHAIDKWVAMLNFADKVFHGKSTPYDYDNVPNDPLFSNLPKAYSWSAPNLGGNRRTLIK